MRRVFEWAGRTGRIANHISTRTPGRNSALIDPTNAVLKIALEYSVQLETLPGRDPERAVAEVSGNSVMLKVLLCAQCAAGQFRPDHEHPSLIEILLFPRRSLVTVILLVGTVELEELIFLLGKMRPLADQSLLNGTS